jgi:hypothetical protein
MLRIETAKVSTAKAGTAGTARGRPCCNQDACQALVEDGMKLVMLILGLLLLVVGAAGFFVLLMRGSESILVYPLAGLMYVGLGVALYAILTFWTDGED